MARSTVRDLTEGRPFRLVVAFAMPLLFGVLFQQLYSFVDTAIVGRTLGAEKLGAVGSTGSINFLILGFCMGICSGFAIPVAQSFGAKDYSEMRRYVVHAAKLCAVIGVLLGVTTALLCPMILRWMNTPREIIEDATAYIRIIFAAIPVTMLYNMTAGILRSLGDSKTPVIFLIIAALLNVALDLAFILWFGMGVAGAAWATAISQLCSGIGCLLFLLHRFLRRLLLGRGRIVFRTAGGEGQGKRQGKRSCGQLLHFFHFGSPFAFCFAILVRLSPLHIV